MQIIYKITINHAICFLCVFISMELQSQIDPSKPNSPQYTLNCHNQYVAQADKYGADQIPDGTYTDILITFRKNASAECLKGKVLIKKHAVKDMYILKDDGSYEKVVRKWLNNSNKGATVSNGISKAMITEDKILVNVIWPNKIRTK